MAAPPPRPGKARPANRPAPTEGAQPPASAAAAAARPVRVNVNRPVLYPKQEAAIYESARYSYIEAGTKSGKTAGCVCWIIEQACGGRPGWNYWWVAPVFSQAKIAFRRACHALNPDCFTKNETELTITINATQTTIWFKGADKPDSLYGEDVHAAVVDEASRVKEDSWFAVRSTLTATQGPIRLIGNVKGRKNWFFKGSRQAAAGEPNSAFHKITCWDAVEAGVLAREEIEDARRKLPDHVFKQLYEAEAAEDEGNPFGIEAIQKLVVPACSGKPAVCWGWDFAKSNDWTVGIGLDRQGNVAKIIRFQAPWGATKARVKLETAGAHCLGDSTGVGDPIVEDLQKMSVDIEAYVFTSRSKQQLMEGLAADIQQGQGQIPAGVLQDELESFEYEYTATGVRYSAPEGMHDDAVCAYAMARMLFRRGYGEPFVYSRIKNDDGGEQIFRSRDFLRSTKNVQMVE